MFTFQAIHNVCYCMASHLTDVKELISMFTFQAIHNIERFKDFTLMMSKS